MCLYVCVRFVYGVSMCACVDVFGMITYVFVCVCMLYVCFVVCVVYMCVIARMLLFARICCACMRVYDCVDNVV